MTPTEIRRDPRNGLTISWQDGSTTLLSPEVLRRECPCATCREKRGDASHSKPLTTKKRALTILESSIAEELDLKEIWGIGQYALGVRWGDGHDSGIYTFDYLYQLGQKKAS
jgi:DUF971 family protein